MIEFNQDDLSTTCLDQSGNGSRVYRTDRWFFAVCHHDMERTAHPTIDKAIADALDTTWCDRCKLEAIDAYQARFDASGLVKRSVSATVVAFHDPTDKRSFPAYTAVEVNAKADSTTKPMWLAQSFEGDRTLGIFEDLIEAMDCIAQHWLSKPRKIQIHRAEFFNDEGNEPCGAHHYETRDELKDRHSEDEILPFVLPIEVEPTRKGIVDLLNTYAKVAQREPVKSILRRVRNRLNETAGGGRTPSSRKSLRKELSQAMRLLDE